MNLPEMLDALKEGVSQAKAMHFDGCHKIYLSMDDEQVAQMESYDYEVVAPDYHLIRQWFEDSCFLRFVQAVRTVEGDPNEGFTNVVPQGWGED